MPLLTDPVDVDEAVAGLGIAMVGKRQSSARTPEPDDASKRVKLDTLDMIGLPTAAVAS